MREGKANGQILRIAVRRGLEERCRLGELTETVVRHAEEDRVAHRFGRIGRGGLEQDGKFGDCGFQVAGFEESQAEVEAEAGHGWLESDGLAIKRNGFFVVILSRFKQAEVRVGFSVGGVGLEDGAPGFFGLGEFALLLEGQGGLTEVRR